MTESEFVRSRYDAHLHFWARVGLGVGTPVVLSLALLDLSISPEHFREFLVYRVATARGILVLRYPNGLRVGERYQSLLGLVAGAMVSTMLALIVAQLGGHRSVYFAGFILVLIFV